MLPNKEAFKRTLNGVSDKTWKMLGGILVFGLLMRMISRKQD
ncbi:hypothetical protein [Lacticaseibacillus saniviri]